jgi:hypothetical protein
MPEFKSAYREQLKRISDEVFAEKLGKEVAAVEAALKSALAKDKAAAEGRNERPGGGMFGGGMVGGQQVTMASFIEKRKQSIDDQLAGNSKGFTPAQGFGPGGFGGGGQLARPLFGALDADQDGKLTEEEMVSGMKKFSREWDSDNSGALDQRELSEGMQKLQPRR